MPCWVVDLWRSIAWWLAIPLPVFSLIVLLLWAPRVKLRWAKVLLRTLGGLAATFALIFAGFGLLFSSGDPKPQYVSSNSPNGAHRATLIYQAGFLGRDVSEVEITSKNKCARYKAYVYEGPSDLMGTTMSWTDDYHLVIKYRLDDQRYQRCENDAGDVSISCVPVPESTK